MGVLAGQLRAINQSRASGEIAKLHPVAQAILPLIHLERPEIARSKNLTRLEVRRAMEGALGSLGLHKQADLGLLAIEAGIRLEIKDPPSLDQLTLRERRVASRLSKLDTEIATELNLSTVQVRKDIKQLFDITGARTRRELVLMNYIRSFEPTEQELEAALGLEVLREFKPKEAQILQKLHLPIEDITAELGPPFTYLIVKETIRRVRQKLGMENNVQLILEMHRRGVQYDTVVPKKPLVELFDSEEMAILGSLDHSNEEIAQGTRFTTKQVGNIIARSKHRLKVRNRHELALVIQVFDTGERRPAAITGKEKLISILGLSPSLSDDQLRSLLVHAGPEQAKYITTRFLSGRLVQRWNDVGEQYGVAGPTAYEHAHNGLKQIRLAIESGETVINQQAIPEDNTKHTSATT